MPIISTTMSEGRRTCTIGRSDHATDDDADCHTPQGHVGRWTPGVLVGMRALRRPVVHEESHIVHHCPAVIRQLTEVLQADGRIKRAFPCQHFLFRWASPSFHPNLSDRKPAGKSCLVGSQDPTLRERQRAQPLAILNKTPQKPKPNSNRDLYVSSR